MAPPSFLLVFFAAATVAAAPEIGTGPETGELTPPHGLSSWLQGEKVELSALRGKVVVLHTFAWNCDSCLRRGIPLSVALQSANGPEELAVISMTTPAMTDETKKVAAEHGMGQPIALANPAGGTSPYVDMGNGFTYMWIIGRNGELVWRGDPSTKEEECLEAVRSALVDRGDRVLDRELHAELASIGGSFARGAYEEARKGAGKVQKKNARKKDEDRQALAADAAYLVERVDARREQLIAALGQAVQNRESLAFVELDTELERGFRKDKSVAAARDFAAKTFSYDPPFKRAVEEAREWIEVRNARPALFGLRNDKQSSRYLKTLRKFLKEHEESRYAGDASKLLTQGELAADRR